MGAQSSQQGQADNTYYILWVIALVVFIGAVTWFLFDYQLKVMFIYLRIGELTALYYALFWIPDNLPWIGDALSQTVSNIHNNLLLVKQVTPDTLNLDVAEVLSETTGNYLRYPASLYLVILSIVVYKTSVQMRLRKKFNMKTLAIQEQSNWPQIQVATKLDLLAEDLDSGPWSMGMSPMQFSKKNKLVTVEFVGNLQAGVSKALAMEYKAVLNRHRAERAFSMQLGRIWQGIENMPPHRRAILATFLARGGRDTQKSQDMVAQLAHSAANGRLDCSGADALWKKHMNNSQVKDMLKSHGYEFTVFISALLFAREDGVLASADFLWVKPLDRRLWFVINNVGRQTPSVEAAGIFSHWYHEKALKRPLNVPMVMNAVDALEGALSDVIYIPDEKERDEIMKRYQSSAKAD